MPRDPGGDLHQGVAGSGGGETVRRRSRKPNAEPRHRQRGGGRLKARLRPMRGLKRVQSARTLVTGHAFVQNLRRGRHEIVADQPPRDRVRAAFEKLAFCV